MPRISHKNNQPQLCKVLKQKTCPKFQKFKPKEACVSLLNCHKRVIYIHIDIFIHLSNNIKQCRKLYIDKCVQKNNLIILLALHFANQFPNILTRLQFFLFLIWF